MLLVTLSMALPLMSALLLRVPLAAPPLGRLQPLLLLLLRRVEVRERVGVLWDGDATVERRPYDSTYEGWSRSLLSIEDRGRYSRADSTCNDREHNTPLLDVCQYCQY